MNELNEVSGDYIGEAWHDRACVEHAAKLRQQGGERATPKSAKWDKNLVANATQHSVADALVELL